MPRLSWRRWGSEPLDPSLQVRLPSEPRPVATLTTDDLTAAMVRGIETGIESVFAEAVPSTSQSPASDPASDAVQNTVIGVIKALSAAAVSAGYTVLVSAVKKELGGRGRSR